MHILIAEDEKHSRAELRYILEQLEPTATFYEAQNGQEALEWAGKRPFDVTFLDINMPGISGLGVAGLLLQQKDPPLIIFATAYDKHAVRAFELKALDYVLKPYRATRLAETMQRIRDALTKRDVLIKKEAVLREYLIDAVPPTLLTKLWGSREDKSGVLVDFKDILWLESDDKTVLAQTIEGEKVRIRLKMRDLEARLAPHNFSRVHKSYIVNLDHVADIQPWFSGTYQIRMDDAPTSKIPMSRNFARQLKQLTGWLS